MVRAWYMDESDADQRTTRMTDPPKFVDLDTLKKKTGIMYFKLDADHWEKEGQLKKIVKERGYTYEDQITIGKDLLPEYEKKIKIFFEEHLHADEEIRFITDGSGYFDARDQDDKWIRIEVVKGDLIILPAGIYHRFTNDTKDYIKAKRLFVGEPVWTPHNRPADDHAARKGYLASMKA